MDGQNDSTSILRLNLKDSKSGHESSFEDYSLTYPMKKQEQQNKLFNVEDHAEIYQINQRRDSNSDISQTNRSQEMDDHTVKSPSIYHHQYQQPPNMSESQLQKMSSWQQKLGRSNSKKQSIIERVNQFVKLLKSAARIGKEFVMSEQNYNMMNDNAHINTEQKVMLKQTNQLKQFIQFLTQYYVQFMGKKKIIQPSNKFRLVLDFTQMILIYVMIFDMTIELFFDSGRLLSGSQIYFFFIMILCFSLSIYVNFITGFYYQGNVQRDCLVIAKHYLQTDFIFDFASLILLLVLSIRFEEGNDLNLKIYCSITILKIVPVIHLYQKLEKMFEMQITYKNTITLIQLLMTIITLSHFVAILWYQLAIFEIKYLNEEMTFLQKYSILDGPWYYKYAYAIYFGECIIMKDGVQTTSPLEIMCGVILKFFTCGMFAYIISCIQRILFDMQKSKENNLKELEAVNKYMNRNQISEDTRTRVREYLVYMQQNSIDVDSHAENDVVNKLSANLKQEIALQLNTRIFSRFHFLRKFFSDKIIKQIIYQIEEVKYGPGQMIYDEFNIEQQLGEEKHNGSLYIITKGQVELGFSKSLYNTSPIIKAENDFFGEVAFFTNQQYSGYAKTLSYCSLYRIDRNNFIKIIQQAPEEYEQFCCLRDSLLFQNNIKLLDINCFGCGINDHQIQFCPKFHLTLNPIYTASKCNFQINQQRSDIKLKFNRRNIRSSRDPKLSFEAQQKLTNENSALIDQYKIKVDFIKQELVTKYLIKLDYNDIDDDEINQIVEYQVQNQTGSDSTIEDTMTQPGQNDLFTIKETKMTGIFNGQNLEGSSQTNICDSDSIISSTSNLQNQRPPTKGTIKARRASYQPDLAPNLLTDDKSPRHGQDHKSSQFYMDIKGSQDTTGAVPQQLLQTQQEGQTTQQNGSQQNISTLPNVQQQQHAADTQNSQYPAFNKKRNSVRNTSISGFLQSIGQNEQNENPFVIQVRQFFKQSIDYQMKIIEQVEQVHTQLKQMVYVSAGTTTICKQQQQLGQQPTFQGRGRSNSAFGTLIQGLTQGLKSQIATEEKLLEFKTMDHQLKTELTSNQYIQFNQLNCLSSIFDISDFEKFKNYKVYYPDYNMENVLKSIKSKGKFFLFVKKLLKLKTKQKTQIKSQRNVQKQIAQSKRYLKFQYQLHHTQHQIQNNPN